MGWRFDQARMSGLMSDNRVIWPKVHEGRPRVKSFLSDLKTEFTGFSSVVGDNVFTRNGTREIEEIFASRPFAFPKAQGLVSQLIIQGCPVDGIVLDSFAGSGTTAHAALALNKQDGGNRRFILVECEDYADTITAERVRRVINGVPEAKGEDLREGLGGSFTYCTLGEPIDAERMLTGETLPNYPDLAAHLLYTAKGITASRALRQPADGDPFYSDPATDTDYYLLDQADSA